MSEPPTRARIEQWLTRWVVGEDICPFAAAPVQAERVRIVICEGEQVGHWVEALIAEITRLVDAPESALETTLLGLPHAPADFLDFLDVIALADDVLAAGGWVGTLQLVPFHPRFQYAESAPDDPGNWTNRSPVPLIHLLRESSVERARHTDTAAISERNQRHTAVLGATGCRARAWGD